jgi:hypothetical protein
MFRFRLIPGLALAAVLVPVASAAADPLPMPAALKRSDKAARVQITSAEPCEGGSSARCTIVWQADIPAKYTFSRSVTAGHAFQRVTVGEQSYRLNGSCWTLDAEPAEVFDSKYGPVSSLVRNLIDVDSLRYRKVKRRSFSAKALGRSGAFKLDRKGRIKSGTVDSKQIGKHTFKVSYPSAAFARVDPAPVCA